MDCQDNAANCKEDLIELVCQYIPVEETLPQGFHCDEKMEDTSEDKKILYRCRWSLWEHLLHCLEDANITPFPQRQCKRKRPKPLGQSTFPIYGSCRLPESGRMIQCGSCCDWFHSDCIQVPDTVWPHIGSAPVVKHSHCRFSFLVCFVLHFQACEVDTMQIPMRWSVRNDSRTVLDEIIILPRTLPSGGNWPRIIFSYWNLS